jgi:hypothetical protein
LESIFLVAIPAVLVLLTTIAVLVQLQRRAEQERMSDQRLKAFATILPMVLAAHERAVLFLDRIRPENLLARVNPALFNAKNLRDELMQAIHTEYEHNAVQQLYVSEKAWNALTTGRDYVLNAILKATEGFPLDKESGMELAKRLHDLQQEAQDNALQLAINHLRRDVQKLMSSTT